MEEKSPATNSETKSLEANKATTPAKRNTALRARNGPGSLKQSNSVIGSTAITIPSANNSPPLRTSRIPTREKSTLSSRNIGKLPPPEKRFSLRKKSKTSLDVTQQPLIRQKTSISSHISALEKSPRPQTPRPQSPRPSRTSPIATSRAGPHVVQSTTVTSKAKSPNRPSSCTINITHGNHRAGEVPSYLKKNDKVTTELLLNTKKRALNTQKRKLVELQTDFLNNYKLLKELQTKYNKCTGKSDRIEEVKLLAVVEGESGEVLIKDGDKTLNSANLTCHERPTSPSKMKADTDLETIRSKLLLIQEAGFKLCQEVVGSFDKIQLETNEVSEFGDGTTLKKQIFQVLKSIKERISQEENEQKKLIAEVISALQNEVSKKHEAGDHKDAPLDHQLKAVKEKELEISKLMMQVEEHKKLLEISNSKLRELETSDINTIASLKNQLRNNESVINEKDKEISWTKESLKRAEELYHKEKKTSLAVSSDLHAKESILHKLKNDLEELKKRNKSFENIREMSKKSMIDKETSVGGGGGGSDRSTYETELYNEVQSLKIAVDRLNKEKCSLEKERDDLSKTLVNYGREDLKLQLLKSLEELKRLNSENACLRDAASRLEATISKKVGIINELERKISNGQYLVNASKELQNEINNLRESETEKRREIDSLKAELTKAHVEIKQQEETICVNQRLLRIRSELINSLQEKEASNRCRMDDLYSEISKKTSLVNQMNHEISAKAEELQNLFSTLGTKQLEVNRQEHVIKMLEENNERNQRLRVKQEDRIARLESENAELKHLLCKYDAGIDEDLRSSHSDKSSPASPRYSIRASKDEENVSTRDLYDFERRKKRRMEIEKCLEKKQLLA